MDVDSPSAHDLNPQSLRALAHPARVEILRLLAAEGPSTSARLARRLQVRSGSTSWHLAKLAEGGLVEEVPDLGTRRERWWRAASVGWSIDAGRYLGDEGSGPNTQVVLDAVLSQHHEHVQRFLREQWSQDWRRAWLLESGTPLHLTSSELAELGDRLRKVLAAFTQERPRTAAPGSEQIVLQLSAFPVRGNGL